MVLEKSMLLIRRKNEKKRTKIIGVIISFEDNPYLDEFIKEITHTAFENGYSIIIHSVIQQNKLECFSSKAIKKQE